MRYAKNCNPSDLWVSYFTSSKEVAKIRIESGEPDIIQIRKTFKNPKTAQDWEYKVLTRLDVWNNNRMLNKGTHKLFHKNDGSTSKLISKNTKLAMQDPTLKQHLSKKAKERGILKVCCIECKREIDIANFKRHVDAHNGLKVFYINNGIIQKRVTSIDEITDGWHRGRIMPKGVGKGKIISQEQRNKQSYKMKGRKKSKETKQKMSESSKNRKLITDGNLKKWHRETLMPDGWYYINSKNSDLQTDLIH